MRRSAKRGLAIVSLLVLGGVGCYAIGHTDAENGTYCTKDFECGDGSHCVQSSCQPITPPVQGTTTATVSDSGVDAPTDTGTAPDDTGVDDTGPADTGAADTGAADTGASNDTGLRDSGTDAADSDAGDALADSGDADA